MEKKAPRIRSTSYLNMIAIADECDDKKIQEFRDGLPEFGKSVFDRIDEGKRMSVVILGLMSKEEIDTLKDLSGKFGNDYLVLFHDFRNLLGILEACRLDIDEVLAETEILVSK